jgi:hypothetical protein
MRFLGLWDYCPGAKNELLPLAKALIVLEGL